MKKENEINDIIDELSKNLIRDGIIKTKDKTDEQIRLEIKDYLFKNINSISDFELSIDFTKRLLTNARGFLETSDFHSALIFYALWIEHWFNHIILLSLKRNNITSTYYPEIIRSTKIKDKYTWLWQLLFLKPLNRKHLKIIDKLFEKRNSFIHYKWKIYDHLEIEKLVAELKENENFLFSVDKTINYLKKFENKNIYSNKKKISRSIIKLTA